MSVLSLVLRVLLLLLLVRLVLRGLAALLRPAPAPREVAPPEEMVRDRVCNTFLRRDRALRATVAGVEEHFCSPACRDRALALAQG
jgi:hypothetical protein